MSLASRPLFFARPVPILSAISLLGMVAFGDDLNFDKLQTQAAHGDPEAEFLSAAPTTAAKARRKTPLKPSHGTERLPNKATRKPKTTLPPCTSTAAA